MYIYADESGDLGWQFEPPYGRRGSSRCFTVFAACVSDEKCHLLDRVVCDMYKASRWATKKERKWTDACEPSRRHFSQRAASKALFLSCPDSSQRMRAQESMMSVYS